MGSVGQVTGPNVPRRQALRQNQSQLLSILLRRSGHEEGAAALSEWPGRRCLGGTYFFGKVGWSGICLAVLWPFNARGRMPTIVPWLVMRLLWVTRRARAVYRLAGNGAGLMLIARSSGYRSPRTCMHGALGLLVDQVLCRMALITYAQPLQKNPQKCWNKKQVAGFRLIQSKMN